MDLRLGLAAILGALLTTPIAGVAQPGSARQVEHARVRLVSETTALVPGTTTTLGVELEIDRGWHLYWPGRNDTGTPPRFEWDLPPGYRIGPVQWPAPHRSISPGGILDHVYEGRVLLPVELSVAEDAPAESQVRLGVRASWVICDADVCLFGGGEDTLSLPVAPPGAEPARSPHAEAFEAARRLIPQPLPEDGSAGVTFEWSGLRLEIRAPGASGLAFFAAEDCLAPLDLIRDGEATGSVLRIRFDPEGVGGRRVRGVLRIVRSGKKHPTYYRVDLVAGGG